MASQSSHEVREHDADIVMMPARTSWPIVLAFGITLVFAGMLTTSAVSVLGAILSVAAAVGWFRDVLPHEAHEAVRVERAVTEAASPRREVARSEIGEEGRRAWL